MKPRVFSWAESYKVWVGTDQDAQKAITVDLLKGDKVVDTKQLSKESGWKAEFESLDTDAKDQYSIKERAVSGFKSSIKYHLDGDNRIATITNVRVVRLPMTGSYGILIVVITITFIGLGGYGYMRLRRKG